MVRTLTELVQQKRNDLNTNISLVNDSAKELDQLRQQDAPDSRKVDAARSRRASAESRVAALRADLEMLEREAADDDNLTRGAAESHVTDAGTSIRTAGGGSTFYTANRSSTYGEHNSGEFLRDLFAYSTGGLRREASERLERHEQEARSTGLLSERANSTTSFGGIVPPQYLIDQYALIARAGRPTANVVQHLPLPSDGMSLIVPRGTTGVATGIQTAENSAVTSTDQVWSNLTIPVFTIAGQNDVSRQALDRAEGVDQIIFGDLAAAYAVGLDQQVISGTGSSGQGLGILNTAGISQASAFTAAATIATFYSKIAGQVNAIQTSRYLAPNVIIMHPRRWNWAVSQLDSSNRPLVTPTANGPFNSYGISTTPIDTGSADAVGSMLGLPVITDASIPTNLGTGALEDVVIVARKEDLLLWEDTSAPFTLRFEQTLASQLSVKLVAYGYGAFTSGRYPSAVGLVGGNAGTSGFGLTTVTF